ncbi:response regulator [Ktedonosporobacter rubrisoli]|uniref:Response regulator n=1 Tax=Ktedonosporobacter rubrisoli TaxID=2509675 RepID=A0A4P6JZ22_KTERU|nr:response regulator [Ktedonosporobacter rubrisoli]QBD80989.1 response regulator [Ktedonosporobacter rubrisoli]
MAQNQEQIFSEAQRSRLKTILIVEDDLDIGEVLTQAILQETPHRAILAADGFTALNIVSKTKPDLFILDYQLPRMNGIELYDQLHKKEELKHIPAMMISARLPQQELRQRQLLGMNKPLDLDDFFNAIERLLA